MSMKITILAGTDSPIDVHPIIPYPYLFIDWGHSVYTDTLDLARKAAVKKLGLFHLNQERTDRQMDDIVQDCRNRIAEKGLDLECFGVASDMEFEL